MHHAPLWVVAIPTVVMLIGFAIAVLVLHPRPDRAAPARRAHDWLYRFLLNKWYFDELYDILFVRSAFWFGRFLWKKGDGWAHRRLRA